MSDRTVAELESSLFACSLALAATDNRLDTFNRENAHLRVVAQNVLCPYGNRASNGACMLGYPGCACMDDLMAVLAFYPEGRDLKAMDRMRTKNLVLEERLVNAKRRLKDGARQFRIMAEGFRHSREPSKAAAIDGLADMMEATV